MRACRHGLFIFGPCLDRVESQLYIDGNIIKLLQKLTEWRFYFMGDTIESWENRRFIMYIELVKSDRHRSFIVAPNVIMYRKCMLLNNILKFAFV